jgi:hypothetical protein
LPRLNPATKRAIEALLNELVDWLLDRYSSAATQLDVLATVGKKQKPFVVGLFPAVVKASQIERSLSTKLGDTMQECAKLVAVGAGFHAETEYVVKGTVSQPALDYIRQLVRRGRASSSGPGPDIRAEMTTLQGLLTTGGLFSHEVKMDLFVRDGTDEYFFDLKTPAPNSDQPRDMKDRLMQARVLRRGASVGAYAVFYYNPNGTAGPYTQGAAYLDYKGGEVLVGRTFWDLLGGSGTYEEVVKVFSDVGAKRAADLQPLL